MIMSMPLPTNQSIILQQLHHVHYSRDYAPNHLPQRSCIIYASMTAEASDWLGHHVGCA